MTLPTTMTAVRLPRFGDAEVLTLEQVPIPQPLDDEVLVRVRAASINPVDRKMRTGKFDRLKQDALPITMGRDLAGTIEAVGTRAHYMLRQGDPVFAYLGFDRGAQAEYVVVRAVEMVAMPTSLDFVQAAAVPLAALTAWQGMFDHGGLQAGQSVLIHGGAGGVGHLAIQLAKARGATVYATCSERDLDYVRDLGADRAIDYRVQPFEEQLSDVDLVFDLIGGETRARSWGVLREGGMLVSTLDSPDPDEAARHKVRAVPRWVVDPNAAQLGEVADLIESGSVSVTVAATFPLADVAAAQHRQETGHDRGKIVLTLD
ncbi:NADP-dependent oxidoreductase [Sphingomonas sp. BT552]|uniref:NADP-dependent oxidoreductase n=1 Tax=Sphingomonas longa TaxID=2778730 RepID=A0ABS2D2R5_9SPHN|nr:MULTISPECIES: NADP-dependent oxidoreductase [Alphaproteobacteria]MBM6575212.1 NADP-dependent oxidoreductase [Sphingomonas sp. BT552]